MNKKILIILSASCLIFVIVAGVILLSGKQVNQNSLNPQPTGSSETPINVSPIQKNQAVVPLPTEEDIIRTFFNLINDKRIPEAISMMAPSAVGDESSKQAWGVQFNAFESISVTSISPSMKEEWTGDNHSYKVELTVTMKPEAAKAVIPNYGYDNGMNIRCISISKISSIWKIAGIATGP